MTDEQENNYIASGGTSCPFCKSQNIQTGDFSIDAGEARQAVQCEDCKKSWEDVYTLTGIIPLED